MWQRRTIILVAMVGCATVPGPRTADERRQAATEDIASCSGLPALDWRALAAPNVERVEPIWFSVQHGRGNVDRELRGVRVSVRPQPGMTAPLMQAMLSCHRARRILGQADGAGDDPFALDDAWVDVSVDGAGAAFVVTARAADERDNQALLARARARSGATAAR